MQIAWCIPLIRGRRGLPRRPNAPQSDVTDADDERGSPRGRRREKTLERRALGAAGDLVAVRTSAQAESREERPLLLTSPRERPRPGT